MSQTHHFKAHSCFIKGEKFTLISERAMYYDKIKALLIADLHIGKVSHFRKNNIPIPQAASQKNFDTLELLICKWKPKKVYFLGDLFHSFYNKEWDQLTFLLAKYSKIEFILISGNHDILHQDNYITAGIRCYDNKVIGPFLLSHHPEENEKYYNLCGHIHPGIKLKGEGKQSMKLPCFYFGENQGILPAFGSFTGTASIKVKQGDQVFAIFKDQIISINTEKKGKD